ncbi:unnamed protein product [Lupinus luteus]|uniref:Transposase n=1 Tax=Lupinus luteus TaxID=3873 RepID=A0AAV1W7N1_LUPLU
MVIIRDIVTDFSEDEDIELCDDDTEATELSCITYMTADPGIPIKALMKEVVSRFGYTVTYRKAWKAKQIAMSRIYGD